MLTKLRYLFLVLILIAVTIGIATANIGLQPYIYLAMSIYVLLMSIQALYEKKKGFGVFLICFSIVIFIIALKQF